MDKKVQKILGGNMGGIPDGSVKLLSYLMKKKFIYYSLGIGYDDYKVPIPFAKNRFTGKAFFLTDYRQGYLYDKVE